ncbi:MAG: hypothetical protein OH339_00760 [Candidatus Parvarchaeota archaeon]|nr:hypothetical protein [Candidatus Haiyanarchaeum thermophilum]
MLKLTFSLEKLRKLIMERRDPQKYLTSSKYRASLSERKRDENMRIMKNVEISAEI